MKKNLKKITAVGLTAILGSAPASLLVAAVMVKVLTEKQKSYLVSGMRIRDRRWSRWLKLMKKSMTM